MKKLLFSTLVMLSLSCVANAELTLTSVFDGQSSSPKGIEIYVGASGAYDGWTVDLEFNANTSFTTAYTFDSTSYNAGDFIYITSTPTDTTLTALTGIIIDDGSFNMNGDDRIRLTDGTNVIDQYGVSATDGTGQPWEYLDSFAYRNNGTSASGAFELGDWNVRPVNSLDSGNGELASTLGNFVAVPEPTAIAFLGLAGLGMGLRRRR